MRTFPRYNAVQSYGSPTFEIGIPIFSATVACAMAASLNENKCDISNSVFANGMAVSKSSTARLRFPLKTNSGETYISAKKEGKSDTLCTLIIT
jgi:hypothetical protein